MKRIMLFLLLLFMLSLIFAGCAQYCGTAPEGETGGGTNGYGNDSPGSCMNSDKSNCDFCEYYFQNLDNWRA